MPQYKWCIVPMCTNTSISTPEKTFVTVPKVPERRANWFAAVKRDINETSMKSALYCCEDHFDLENDMENYMRHKLTNVKMQMKPDVIPYKFDCQPEGCIIRPKISKKKAKEKGLDIYLDEENPQACLPQTCEKACQTRKMNCRNKSVQTIKKLRNMDIASVPESFGRLKKRLRPRKDQQELKNTATQILDSDICQSGQSTKCSDSEIGQISAQVEQENIRKLFMKIIEDNLKMYTGIPNSYIEFINILQERTVLLRHEIFITLYKIKTNDAFIKIGHLFGVSEMCADEIFTQSVGILKQIEKEFIYWPENEVIEKNLPVQFRTIFSQVQSIIDYLEVEIKKPTDTLQQSLTWSKYKNCYTIKYLISSTPDGFINFVSCGFGGGISDTTIFEECGYLQKLPNNCTVMADGGFNKIGSILNKKNCALIRPPSVIKKEGMFEDEVKIDTERVIKGIRDFQLLSPHVVLDAKIVQNLNNIVKVVCVIINLQQPIITQ